MARLAIEEHKGFEFCMFWMTETVAWQEKARVIFWEELRKQEKYLNALDAVKRDVESKKTESRESISRLAGALRYAISVIESYQLDVRNSKEIGGRFKKLPQLSDMGFCQGTFYMEAFGTIERIGKGEIPPPFGSSAMEYLERVKGEVKAK